MESTDLFFNFFDLRAFLLCCILVLTFYWYVRRPHNLPPGPLSLPFFGCILTQGYTFFKNRRQPQVLLTRLASQYGDVYCLDLGVIFVMVLSRYEDIKEAFRNPNLNDRPRDIFLEELHFKPGVVMASGECWKLQRKFILHTLRELGIGKRSFEEHISEETDALMEEFLKHQNQPFDPRHHIKNAVSNIICSVIFGKRFEYSDASFRELLDLLDDQLRLMGGGALRVTFQPLKYLSPKKHKQLADIRVKLKNFVKKIVDEHRVVNDPECPGDLIDVFLNQTEVDEASFLTTIANLFSGGSDTVAETLRWGLMYLITYPNIQQRIQDEIDSVVGRDRHPRLSDMPDLPYTQATIWEVQRIATVTPLGGIHLAAQDVDVCGYRIPQGAFIFGNQWAVHHDPRVWDNPEEFKPSRFLNESGKAELRSELIPFSTGHRFCLGQNLAKMELNLLFPHLLHRFTFKKVEDEVLSFQGVVGLTHAAKPFNVIINERQ